MRGAADEIATSLCSSQQIRRNKADAVKLARLNEVKNVDYEEKGHGRRNIQSDSPENQNKTKILLVLNKHRHFS